MAPVYFYLTLPFSLLAFRLSDKEWFTRFAEDAYVSGAVLAFHVAELRDKGVTGVVNLCDEYAGPVDAYKSAGITQLHLPVVDRSSD